MNDTSLDREAAGGLVEGAARVVAASPEAVWLEAESTSACGGCASSGSCGVSAIGKAIGTKTVCFRLDNDFDARPGEQVVVGISQAALLKASAVVYMVPIAGLVLGAVAGAASGLGNMAAAVGAVGGLGAGFALSKYVGSRSLTGGCLDPVFLHRAQKAHACRTNPRAE